MHLLHSIYFLLFWTVEPLLGGTREYFRTRILVPFKKAMDYYLSTNAADTHCFRFSANALKGLLSISGFEVSFVNRFIDSDILRVIGRKVQRDQIGTLIGDDYLDVYSFFERWHFETQTYYKQWAKTSQWREVDMGP